MSKDSNTQNNIEAKHPATPFIYAGMKGSTVCIGFPFDVAKTRMFTSHEHGLISALNSVYKKEGIGGFYARGFKPTLIKMAGKEGYRGIVFELYDHGPWSAVINAMLDTMTMPMDKMTILQQNKEQQEKLIKTITEVCAKGLKHPYSGSELYFSKQLSSHSLTLGFQKIADGALDYVYDGKEPPYSARLAGSVVAGIGVATVLTPLNKILTQIMAETEKGTPIEIAKKNIEKNGIKSMFKASPVNCGFSVFAQMGYLTSKYLCEQLNKHDQEPETGFPKRRHTINIASNLDKPTLEPIVNHTKQESTKTKPRSFSKSFAGHFAN